MKYNYYTLLGMDAYENLFKALNLKQLKQTYYQSMDKIRCNTTLSLEEKVEHSIKIIDAYNCLSDSKRKEDYDNKLHPFCTFMLEEFKAVYLEWLELLEFNNKKNETIVQRVDKALKIKLELERIEKIKNENQDFQSYLNVYWEKKENHFLKKK